MEIHKYAAIDIGSNAVRLLTKNVIEVEGKSPQFKTTSLVRVPIRLGADVFKFGKISERNIRRMESAMQGFKLLMEAHEIEAYRAYATSAMRDAENGEELADKIKAQTGISIKIIEGKHEAVIIARTDLHELVRKNKTYLYVDVGGGSTEFTVFSEGRALASKSFELGTVRLLNESVHKGMWGEAEAWVKKHTAEFRKIYLIGSGGNINHLFSRSGKKPGAPLNFGYISSYYQFLKALTYEERVSHLKMKLDRADVIVPAIHIYLSAMKWSDARKLYVPKIGLADGIIKSIYNDRKKSLSGELR